MVRESHGKNVMQHIILATRTRSMYTHLEGISKKSKFLKDTDLDQSLYVFRVMTPFELSKSTPNYVYFTLLSKMFPYKIAGTGALTTFSLSKNQPNIYSSCTPKKVTMTPIDVSKIIFPLTYL